MRLSKDEEDFLFHIEGSKESKESLVEHYRKEREKGVPHVYICGKMLFFDLEIYVTPACLIPRLETEILVERSLLKLPAAGKVLDLCCGSGVIGLAIKSKRPLLDIVLSDISGKALEVARKNVLQNNLDVKVVEGDFLTPFPEGEFDGIVCNPPYITKEEYEGLEDSVKEFEPKISLTDNLDGLSFYRRLAKEAFYYLKPSGILCLEIGKDQGKQVRGLFSDDLWEKAQVEKDYSSHDRFVFIKRRGKGVYV